MTWPRVLLMLIFCGLLSACRNDTPPPPVNTGSREVATAYFEALAKQDLDKAYAQLHVDSQKQMDRTAFERRVAVYHKKLGFALGKVSIRSCDEQGQKAIAQVILSDVNGSAKHRFHEGVVLHKIGDGWKIVLPSNFGK